MKIERETRRRGPALFHVEQKQQNTHKHNSVRPVGKGAEKNNLSLISFDHPEMMSLLLLSHINSYFDQNIKILFLIIIVITITRWRLSV